MTAPLLDSGSRGAIDRLVASTLDEAGYSGGSVDLTRVRKVRGIELVRYRLAKPDDAAAIATVLGLADCALSRHQVLREALKVIDAQAPVASNQRRIFIEWGIPTLRMRWVEAHEIMHCLLPWHLAHWHGNGDVSFLQSRLDHLEIEANYGAGKLLFPANDFDERVRSEQLSFQLVRQLAKYFGNTIASTLLQAVERSTGTAFAVVIKADERLDATRWLLRGSADFSAKFSQVVERDLASRATVDQTTGPFRPSEIVLRDDSGKSQEFLVEGFGNTYGILLLGVPGRSW